MDKVDMKIEYIKVPLYYFIDDEGKVVVDEECMTEEFKEKIPKVSRILVGKKELE